METEPFTDLDDLYDKLENLSSWPDTTELRECTEYVYEGKFADVEAGKLRKLDRDKQPKTIVCHDMKGGYLEDRFINGSTVHDSYVFYHWNLIDTFIYFSHKMVTIPPYGWVNAAHLHGVKILGTVITERIDGERVWERVLANRNETRKFADALVRIAKFYKFEGWLLNVENKIAPIAIDDLVYFVNYLTERSHEEIPDSEIIWYDSVTHDGELKWQNELNSHNKRFFDNCDGIFLNYNWSDLTLLNSRTIAERNNRIRDVYVGLDVWGRGCPGGGGFNSAHALERIRKQDLSVAIFAPGWTHEYFDRRIFYKLENIFWAQLSPYLYIHVPIYENEIFSTSFCYGSGLNYYRNGQREQKVVYNEHGYKLDKPFYNLSMQKPQILLPGLHLKFTSMNIPPVVESKEKNVLAECTFESPFETMKVIGKNVQFVPKSPNFRGNYMEHCEDYAYEGGSCLKLIINDENRFYQSHYRLFFVHIDFDQELQASLIYKEDNEFGPFHSFNDPILVLKNDTQYKRILPSESHQIDSKWRKRIFLTNLRTVTEIGVIFNQPGHCCIGELVIEPKQQRLIRKQRLAEAESSDNEANLFFPSIK